MSLYKSSFKGYGCPYTNLALRVTDIPINPETKPRLGGLDRLDLLSLYKEEGLKVGNKSIGILRVNIKTKLISNPLKG
jgi:hypothetical protein